MPNSERAGAYIPSVPAVLPYYVDTENPQPFDVAYPANSGFDIFHAAASGYVDLILTFFASIVTSAAVLDRVVRMTISDNNGSVIASIPSTITQPGTRDYFYTWAFTVTTAYSLLDAVANAGYVNLPLPAIPLLPGYKAHVQVFTHDGADQIQQAQVTGMRFPTRSDVSLDGPLSQLEPLALT